ncbi:hypothetical protein QTN25_006536 [Entamoeba marina]
MNSPNFIPRLPPIISINSSYQNHNYFVPNTNGRSSHNFLHPQIGPRPPVDDQSSSPTKPNLPKQFFTSLHPFYKCDNVFIKQINSGRFSLNIPKRTFAVPFPVESDILTARITVGGTPKVSILDDKTNYYYPIPIQPGFQNIRCQVPFVLFTAVDATTEEIIDKLKDDCIKHNRVIDSYQNQLDIETKEVISLNCPYSYVKCQKSNQRKSCEHDCRMDMSSLISCWKRQCWECYCKQPCLWTDVMIDNWFAEIVHNSPENARYVEIENGKVLRYLEDLEKHHQELPTDDCIVIDDDDDYESNSCCNNDSIGSVVPTKTINKHEAFIKKPFEGFHEVIQIDSSETEDDEINTPNSSVNHYYFDPPNNGYYKRTETHTHHGSPTNTELYDTENYEHNNSSNPLDGLPPIDTRFNNNQCQEDENTSALNTSFFQKSKDKTANTLNNNSNETVGVQVCTEEMSRQEIDQYMDDFEENEANK